MVANVLLPCRGGTKSMRRLSSPRVIFPRCARIKVRYGQSQINLGLVACSHDRKAVGWFVFERLDNPERFIADDTVEDRNLSG